MLYQPEQGGGIFRSGGGAVFQKEACFLFAASSLTLLSHAGYYLDVSPKKNSPKSAAKAIRLKPSVTDYATFVRTTSKVLGTTGPAAQKTRPNKLVLWVANMAS